MRLVAFILALLLLAGAVDPTRGPLIALTVVTGIAAFRVRPWRGLDLRPHLDLRMASFVFAVLLLAGTIDATRDWLIGLTIVTGLAAFCPHVLSLDGRRRGWRWRRGDWTWDGAPW